MWSGVRRGELPRVRFGALATDPSAGRADGAPLLHDAIRRGLSTLAQATLGDVGAFSVIAACRERITPLRESGPHGASLQSWWSAAGPIHPGKRIVRAARFATGSRLRAVGLLSPRGDFAALARVTVLNPYEFALDSAGYGGVVAGGDHVDFAADAEFREVDAGFDGEAGEGEDAAGVVGFEVVEVSAGAVELSADVVAGAVGEVLAVAGGADDGAGGVVGLKPEMGRPPSAKAEQTASMAASRASRTQCKDDAARARWARD